MSPFVDVAKEVREGSVKYGADLIVAPHELGSISLSRCEIIYQ